LIAVEGLAGQSEGWDLLGYVFETHCHSYVSDGAGSPELLVRVAARRGIQVLSVTDHDTFMGSVLASRASKLLNAGVTIIYGAEVLTNWGDILVYCPEPISDPIPPDFMELRDKAKAYNCLLVAPHPFQPLMPSVGRRILESPHLFDGVEVWNGKSIPAFNIPALIYSRRLGIPTLSGSDAHTPSAIGVSPSIVFSSSVKPEDVLEAVGKGLVRPSVRAPSLKALVEDIAWSIRRRGSRYFKRSLLTSSSGVLG